MKQVKRCFVVLFAVLVGFALFYGIDILLAHDGPSLRRWLSEPKSHKNDLAVLVLSFVLIVFYLISIWLQRKWRPEKKAGFLGLSFQTLAIVVSLVTTATLVKTLPGLTAAQDFVDQQKEIQAVRFCSSSGYNVCVEKKFCEKLTADLVVECSKKLGVWGTIRPQLSSRIEARLRKCALLEAYDRIRLNRSYKRCLDSHSY